MANVPDLPNGGVEEAISSSGAAVKIVVQRFTNRARNATGADRRRELG